MISYHVEVQVTVQKLVESLKDAEYNVWIVDDQKNGYSPGEGINSTTSP